MTLIFDNSRKKPRKIKQVLPWPPSPGLMKEMEQGLIEGCTFEIPIIIHDKPLTNEDVMKRKENKRKL